MQEVWAVIFRKENMNKTRKIRNYAFIDGNNLYLGAQSQSIDLDYGKLRKYLRSKLFVDKAFLFIGYDAHNTLLYNKLQSYGYILVFKPTIPYTDENTGERTMKGNVDAELVLYSSAIEYDNYNKAVIVSSDGDFACLMRYLNDLGKLEKIITPTLRYSKLLRPYSEFILPLKTIKRQVSGKQPSAKRKNRHSRSVQEP